MEFVSVILFLTDIIVTGFFPSFWQHDVVFGLILTNFFQDCGYFIFPYSPFSFFFVLSIHWVFYSGFLYTTFSTSCPFFGIEFHARYLIVGVVPLLYHILGLLRGAFIGRHLFISLLGIRYGYRLYISKAIIWSFHSIC